MVTYGISQLLLACMRAIFGGIQTMEVPCIWGLFHCLLRHQACRCGYGRQAFESWHTSIGLQLQVPCPVRLDLHWRSIGTDSCLLALQAREGYEMTTEEKLSKASDRKEAGNALFKSGANAAAVKRYKRATELINFDDQFSAEEKRQSKDIKKSCNLNLAAAYLKLKDFSQAQAACSKVHTHAKKGCLRPVTSKGGKADVQSCSGICTKRC